MSKLLIQYGERDFPEDSSHENGDYFNHCCYCKQQFRGHKRRVVCKLCVGEPNDREMRGVK